MVEQSTERRYAVYPSYAHRPHPAWLVGKLVLAGIIAAGVVVAVIVGVVFWIDVWAGVLF